MSSTHPDEPTEVLLSEEHMTVSTRWETSGRLRLNRRVITQTQQIQVTVRREELIVDWEPATPEASGPIEDLERWQPTQTREPLVIVLHEEVPEVTLRVRAYERTTAIVTHHDGDIPVTGILRKENATLEPRTGAALPRTSEGQ